MLRWSILFLVISLVAALFGFGIVADYSWNAAKLLCFVFLVLFLLSLVFGRRWPADLP